MHYIHVGFYTHRSDVTRLKGKFFKYSFRFIFECLLYLFQLLCFFQLKSLFVIFSFSWWCKSKYPAHINKREEFKVYLEVNPSSSSLSSSSRSRRTSMVVSCVTRCFICVGVRTLIKFTSTYIVL